MSGIRLHIRKASAVLLGLASLGAAAAGPDIQHWRAETGARVYFVESRALPLVDIQVDFVAGSALDPDAKAGLASLTHSLLDSGAEGLTEQEIAERMADTGARLGGGIEADRASVSLRTLSSESERVAAVTLAARLLAQPTFPGPAFERERSRNITGLREALTKPETLAARRFKRAIYGDHPYGRLTTVESLERITRADLVRFHRARYSARNASVSIVGDVSRSDAEQIANQLTAALPAGTAPVALGAPQMPARTSEHIEHPSAQAHILMGMPALTRDDPDYFPLLVGNYALGGGGFVSRLTKEVREKRGFAYSVYSFFQPQKVAGPFQIGLQTRGSQAAEARQVAEDVLTAFVAEGPSEEELQAARDNIINGFGLRLDSNRKILDYVATIGFYELPLDWLETYPREVAKVTVATVRDAFSRRIRAEHLVAVVAGGDGDRSATGNDKAGAQGSAR
jgi:zinc protease